MFIKAFLKLVEIQTKVASVIPFLLGTAYALYRFKDFNLKNFLLMMVSLLCIDMATTAINNYLDFKRAHRKYGYGYENHNAIVHYKMKESTVIAIILVLLTIAVIFGTILYLNTNFVVLALGVISFGIGILYSFGPVPISRTPFGELFSGAFMGGIITFIAVYIHAVDKNLLNIGFTDGMLRLEINILEVIYILLISASAIAGIANIMLANNICDIEDDIENKRYTLPIYIGRKMSLLVFRLLYYTGYLSLIVLLILRVAPVISVLSLGTFILVNKHIGLFEKLQSKKDTFVLAVKNFVVMNASLVLTLFIAILFMQE